MVMHVTNSATCTSHQLPSRLSLDAWQLVKMSAVTLLCVQLQLFWPRWRHCPARAHSSSW
jgi:hypothetical protein